MNDRESIQQALRLYVDENCLYMRRGVVVGDDESLLTRGVIDSLGVVELVAFVEERWNISVDAAEIVEANFGTFNAITRFVLGRIDQLAAG